MQTLNSTKTTAAAIYTKQNTGYSEILMLALATLLGELLYWKYSWADSCIFGAIAFICDKIIWCKHTPV